MSIVFRVDSSFEIGTGHMMRCLCLAKYFLKITQDIFFICRDLPGNSIEKIISEGFKVIKLPTGSASVMDQGSLYFNWLGVAYETEISQSKNEIKKLGPDLLIVDHYALDSKWESEMRGFVNKIFVIDDLANRRHDCDFLLDQTHGRIAIDYAHLVPDSCHQFLGTDFSLLRPEFASKRQESLKRKEKLSEKPDLLISMGGIDQNNVTGQVLKCLFDSGQINFFQNVRVILGKHAPHYADLYDYTKQKAKHVLIMSDIADVAEVMVKSDVAIGAAGTSTWERCCLGLPTILLKIAENQAFIFNKMRESRAVVAIEEISQLRDLDFSSIDYVKLSTISSSLVDGLGAVRVLDALTKTNSMIRLTEVCPEDIDFLFLLQSREGVRTLSRNPQVPSYQEHVNWFEKTLKDTETILYILRNDLNKVGMLRIKNKQSQCPEVSIIVDPTFALRGYAQQALKLLKEKWPQKCFKATVHKENTASKKLFVNSGYKFVSEKENFEEYLLEGSK